MVLLSKKSSWWQLSIFLLCASATISLAQGGNTSSTNDTNTTTSEITTMTPSTEYSTKTASSTLASAPGDHCGDTDNTMTVMVAVFATLFFITLVFSGLLLLILCCVCSRRRESEVKQYVFEEGVQPPELWVDPDVNADEKTGVPEPDELPSSFSPSPQSKNTTMTMPDVSSNGALKPVPVQPVRVRTFSRFRPKRVAPPPPKRKQKRHKSRSKSFDETVEYAVPSPYLKPVQNGHVTTDSKGYAVPKPSKSSRRFFPHIYKSIDVAKVKPPNPYADLVVKAEHVKSDKQ